MSPPRKTTADDPAVTTEAPTEPEPETAPEPEFVCVGMPREDATGADDWENVVGIGGLAFKIGAAINGSMDNIAMWAGLGGYVRGYRGHLPSR